MNFSDIKYIGGVTKVIVPFQFDYNSHVKKNKDIVDGDKVFYDKLKLDKYEFVNRKGKKIKPFRKTSLIPNDLYGGLESMTKDDGKYLIFERDYKEGEGESTKIVDIYELNHDDSREEFFLDKKIDYKYECKYLENGIEKKIIISIPNIRVYLFETLDGFVEYECKYESENANDYINTNFCLCQFNNKINNVDKYKFTYKKNINKDEVEEREFSLKQITEKIFEILGAKNIHNFDEHISDEETDAENTKEKETFKYNPQIFSYVLFEKKPNNVEELNRLLFHIRKNYKSSFKFPSDSINSDKFIYQSFDNSYWTFSLNATVNVSFLTGDEITDNYFKHQFENNILSTYYFLYICVLNQRYGIIIQKGKLGQLDEYGRDYMHIKRQLKTVQKYKTRALKFKYKAFFKSPSKEEHINDYFRKVSISQNIYESYTSFISDLNDTETIHSALLKKANDDEDEIKKVSNYQQDMFVTLIGNIVAICQLLMAKAALLGSGLKWYDILINTILVLLPIATMIMNMNSKLDAIYAIVKAKGADKMLGKTKEERFTARKEAIKKDFHLTPITEWFIFRKIRKDGKIK